MENAIKIRNILALNSYSPFYEKLTGDLAGKFSRRINIKHRLVYEVFEDSKTVIALCIWSH